MRLILLIVAAWPMLAQVKVEMSVKRDASGCTTPRPMLGVPHRCEGGKWVEDLEAIRSAAAAEAERKRLYNAAISRVLTDAEMAEVLRRGLGLVQPVTLGLKWTTPEQDLAHQKLLDEVILQQARLRSLAKGCKQ